MLLIFWAFARAAAVVPGTSTAQNPQASFATFGTKQVILKACNAGGCTTVTKTITVLDPTPVIDQSAIGGTAFTAGQLVNLSAAAHGRPPLAYSWQILSSDLEVDLAGAATWWDTSTAPPGLYVVTLAVTNTDGKASSLPVPVMIAADAGAGFYTLAPCRLLDTRTGAPLSSNAPLAIPIAGAAGCGVPPTARAIAANVTVVSPTAAGNVALYPGNYPRPPVSTVNFAAGQTRANNAIIALASDSTGTIAARASVGATGSVQLIVDVDGYFQ
jgi:hypothetical protein